MIDGVRSAVNTTVMATEAGSKAVDQGAAQVSEMATSFGQIAGLVSTTTDAAREIELSTKQQATAVEQVNSAIGSIAQEGDRGEHARHACVGHLRAAPDGAEKPNHEGREPQGGPRRPAQDLLTGRLRGAWSQVVWAV